MQAKTMRPELIHFSGRIEPSRRSTLHVLKPIPLGQPKWVGLLLILNHGLLLSILDSPLEITNY